MKKIILILLSLLPAFSGLAATTNRYIILDARTMQCSTYIMATNLVAETNQLVLVDNAGLVNSGDFLPDTNNLACSMKTEMFHRQLRESRSGNTNITAKTSATITFDMPLRDTNYEAIPFGNGLASTLTIANKTTNGFIINLSVAGTGTLSWIAVHR